MTDSLTNAKIIIYILTASIMKVNPDYFSNATYQAIASSEKELLEGLKGLDDEVSVNNLMVALFSKGRMH